jgi:hypothetical protein
MIVQIELKPMGYDIDFIDIHRVSLIAPSTPSDKGCPIHCER